MEILNLLLVIKKIITILGYLILLLSVIMFAVFREKFYQYKIFSIVVMLYMLLVGVDFAVILQKKEMGIPIEKVQTENDNDSSNMLPLFLWFNTLRILKL